MIVELCGLPGSGKTTIARKLAEHSGFTRVKITKKSELVWLNIVFLMKHPIRFFILLLYIILYASGCRMFYYKFINLFLHHNAKYEKALRYPDAILDQGYFQNVLSLFESPVSVKTISRYVKFFRLPDLLVIVDAADSDLEKRMQGRGHSPREEFGRGYVSAWKKTVLANYRTLMESRNQFSVRSEVIDANKSIDGMIDDAMKVIALHK